jgi:hypothetical protein
MYKKQSRMSRKNILPPLLIPLKNGCFRAGTEEYSSCAFLSLSVTPFLALLAEEAELGEPWSRGIPGNFAGQ